MVNGSECGVRRGCPADDGVIRMETDVVAVDIVDVVVSCKDEGAIVMDIPTFVIFPLPLVAALP